MAEKIERLPARKIMALKDSSRAGEDTNDSMTLNSYLYSVPTATELLSQGKENHGRTIHPQQVVAHYSTLALEDPSKKASHAAQVASSFGYSPENLAAVPEGANFGVSYGNLLAIEKSGEIVLDLGSGAGFDVFQAARKVGPSGTAIGLDLSPSMLSLASLNASKGSFTNTKFILSPITSIPLEDESVDCVISILIVDKKNDLNIYKERLVDKEQGATQSCGVPASSSCCGVSHTKGDANSKKESAERIAGLDFNEWVNSYSIYAVKPTM
ncbi:hypothetical protein G7Y89_g6185 [Cudoniella acicularis]|uniref:Arsenite methyltransferase n=1 Tax=Cudoniella acicularis TaxID=354080 RepID=A0A8H4RPA7_9HELO|nr:hypothetical protein G7Y89_g6185 [Cudoniella acicularis]